MIGEGTVLALIPARGGSKGIPRKNLQEVAGKPLIFWSIDAARRSRYVDSVVVSTDDDELAKTARAHGADVPFIRPAALAADDTPGMSPVLHAIDKLPNYRWVVLLQPTSPLRLAADIDACVERCVSAAAPACVSVCEPDHNPYLSLELDSNNQISPLHGWEQFSRRRQDFPRTYVLNGAVYVARADWLVAQRSFISPETVAHIMPRDRSIDIDTYADLNLARALLKEAKA